jgi:FK506-binding protein 2
MKKGQFVCTACLCCWFADVGRSFSLPSTNGKASNNNNNNNNNWNQVAFVEKPLPFMTTNAVCSRRHTLTTFVVSSAWISSSLALPPVVSNAAAPLMSIPVEPAAMTTVVLDSPTMKIGVELYNVMLGGTSNNPRQTFPAVKTVQRNGVAAAAQIQPGMILLGNYPNDEASESVIRRIQQGPYPIVLQFYDLAKAAKTSDITGTTTTTTTSPQEALLAAQRASQEAAVRIQEPPPLSAKGTGLIVKTIQKPTTPCNKDNKAQRGDTLEISFEARVASPGGPVYDSTQQRGQPSVSFVKGSGEVINGVDIGVNDMCPGEIRTMDIPAGLGYGRTGSEVFDVPGDVRLWWKVELLSLTKTKKGPS